MKSSLGARTWAMPTPVWLIGTYDSDHRPNVMAVAWGSICCSKPPCVAVSLRKATYSYASLVARKAFTVSVPSARYVHEADYCGIVSGRTIDKFATCGLTPVQSEVVDAPYVGEFPLVLECKLLHTIELGLHTQFVGEIIDVKADASVMGADGNIDAALIQPFTYDPSTRNYYGTGASLGKSFTIGKTWLGDRPPVPAPSK
jgi:flavin reductase (DIM6/NTAB) family NADH-FMN oxidoreductase RutF